MLDTGEGYDWDLYVWSQQDANPERRGEAICASRQPLDEIAYCNSISALDRGNRWQEAIQQLQDMESYGFWTGGLMNLV